MENLSFTFGKYIGKTIDDVFKEDKGYIRWLTKQKWFRDKFIKQYQSCLILLEIGPVYPVNEHDIIIYTDGACSGNPGIGGWGVVILINGNNPIFLNGGENQTTNNRMELTATIKALKHFTEPQLISLITDSKYVKDGIESWITNWKKNGWRTTSKKPVKNKELWVELDSQIVKHNIKWKWVKGHTGDSYNEKADFLARRFIEES